MSNYDSREDTLAHIRTVQQYLAQVAFNLGERSSLHDVSKLAEPEKALFDIFTPMLKNLTYGSDEYNDSKAKLGVALEHHYANNPHHPEHWPNGLVDMSLLDIIEMLIDWKAASERHTNGDIYTSIELNQERFGYSDELKAIFINTAEEMGW